MSSEVVLTYASMLSKEGAKSTGRNGSRKGGGKGKKANDYVNNFPYQRRGEWGKVGLKRSMTSYKKKRGEKKKNGGGGGIQHERNYVFLLKLKGGKKQGEEN